MLDYKYQAINFLGTLKEGTLSAISEKEVIRQLKGQNLALLKLSTIENSSKPIQSKSKKVSKKTVLTFTRQLLALFKTGIPLYDCLQLLMDQSGDENFKDILMDISQQIKSGKIFSEAMRDYPKVFNSLYINSIHMGELSGSLENVLADLIKQIENDIMIHKNLTKAFRYPLIVMVMMLGAVIVFINFVIPNFKPLFEKAGQELPLPTRIILSLSDISGQYGFLILIFSAVISTSIYFIYRSEKGKSFFHNLFLKLPVYGMLLQKIAAQRLANTIALMSKNGIPLYQGLNSAIEGENNVVFKNEIVLMKKKIVSGKSLSDAMKEAKFIPSSMAHLVSVGEMSGSLEEMMSKMAEFSESEVLETIERLVAFIEPVVTIVMAAMVLILALSIFLPMWNMLGIQQ